MGTQQEHPKKLRLLVDVSGSMYRFNGHDGRLEREMETVIMAMEALEGYEDKIVVRVQLHYSKTEIAEFAVTFECEVCCQCLPAMPYNQ